MADPSNSVAPGDDVLTAYLDNEVPAEERRVLEARLAVDPELKGRLDALAASSRPYKHAFALVLDAAPRDRLSGMLTALVPVAEPRAPRRFWMSAAAVALLAIGVGIGVAVRNVPQTPPLVTATGPVVPPVPGSTQKASPVTVQPAAPAASAALAPSATVNSAAAPQAAGTVAPPPSWRQVVAEYLVLTTPETLSILPTNPRLGEAVAAYGGKLQLVVSTDQLMLPMAALKDVRLFDYRGRPLVEASYLSDDQMSVALCIILSSGQPDATPSFEQREGQNIVFWTKGGHGFMIAGMWPRERLEALARELWARFS